MPLLNNPTRAFNAGRQSRRDGRFATDLPGMPPELVPHFKRGWHTQHTIMINSRTKMLCKAVEHHDLCSDALERQHTRTRRLQLTADAQRVIARIQEVAGCSVDKAVSIACQAAGEIFTELGETQQNARP